MDAHELNERLPSAAFAFQGYDMANLGRSHALLEHPQFGGIVEDYLARASIVCNEFTDGKTNLIQRMARRLRHEPRTDLRNRVWANQETTLETFAEAVGLIVAMELAQIDILQRVFEVPYARAGLAYGHSLGEIAAVVAGGLFTMEDVLKVPLSLARDCVRLADGVTLGILFSRDRELPLDEATCHCAYINREGDGAVGVSAQLSPNSLLVMGRSDTLDRLRARIQESHPSIVRLRKNSGNWPPLHTLLVREACIPNRSSVMLRTMPGGFGKPSVPILSMVTGEVSYGEYNARDLLSQWSDHPQRVWDAVYGTLTRGIRTVIHVGPAPNIFPSTFRRLSDNVEAQLKSSRGTQAISGMVRRPWLKAFLPERAALLRAPHLEHLVLEDWLLGP